jgi:hypothetical protein
MRAWLRDPLVLAAGLVTVSTATGFLVAWAVGGKTGAELRTASVTLLFVALLGGVVKLLLDDVQRTRDQRAERARFLRAVLDDLKAVYDRVERVRTLIRAHRSALTYGNEMRDLIDARVRLKNVVRALEPNEIKQLAALKRYVKAMETYLQRLTDEFAASYKPISDEQLVYEARKKKALDRMQADGPAPVVENAPWRQIAQLPHLSRFIGDEPTAAGDAAGRDHALAGDYQEFTDPLDRASEILRRELLTVLGRRPR